MPFLMSAAMAFPSRICALISDSTGCAEKNKHDTLKAVFWHRVRAKQAGKPLTNGLALRIIPASSHSARPGIGV
jgi:hypothetical protein